MKLRHLWFLLYDLNVQTPIIKMWAVVSMCVRGVNPRACGSMAHKGYCGSLKSSMSLRVALQVCLP